MNESNKFNLSTQAAENYEAKKVPAIFGPMAEVMLDAIDLPAGAAVVDIACGTGAVARAVAARLTEPSRITGVDLNPAMIEIARQRAPAGQHAFDWQVAPADNLPFQAGQFDLAFCQQGLQFFNEKPAALAEMRRVLRPGGRLFLTCWASIPPFFETVAAALKERLSEAAAATAIEPFTWNDEPFIRGLIAAAGFELAPARRVTVTRNMAATCDAIAADMLATPNEPTLRAAGDAVIDAIARAVLDGVSHFRQGDMLAMPQDTYLFEATAR